MSFKSYDPSFEDILGPSPKIQVLLEKDYPFAHEAGIFIADTNELFITSNRLYDNSGNQNVEIARIQLHSNSDDITNTATHGLIQSDNPHLVMANGGVNHRAGMIICAQGDLIRPSGLYQVSITPPYTSQLLVSDFYGRPFNSVNDVVVHSDQSIWFTDPTYGYEQGYRPKPRLPSQVYRFQPSNNGIRAVADGFGHPNGLCFSPDEKILYVTDTDWICGDGTTDDTRVSSIYAFDVMIVPAKAGSSLPSQFLSNRRLFAMCDTGVPDGIKCDLDGNVYSGCGDGVNVWSPGGILLGKILVDGGVANFCFGRKGQMFLLNETRIWMVQLAESVRGALLRI